MESEMEMSNKKGRESIADCPSIEIAAYLDGELSPADELYLEAHIGNCHACSQELNSQKQLINTLSCSLDNTPELPRDFAKFVVVNAESSVGGLRRSNERLTAMYVCGALFFVVMFTLGAAAPGAFAAFFSVIEKVYAVLSFVFHFVFDVCEGIIILLRAFLAQPGFNTSFAIGSAVFVSAAGLYIYLARSNSRRSRIESGNIV
jgi:hypothetical protein